MDAIRTHEDIEAQMRNLQSRKKDLIKEMKEKDRVAFGEIGFYDRDIYGGGGDKYDGYVTSIAANDEVHDEDDIISLSQSKRPGYTAPAALLNDVAQSEKDYDPFAERRRPTIAEKEDEYRQKRLMMIISPERVDPFAEGGKTPDLGSRTYAEIMKEELLLREEAELWKLIVEKSKNGTLKVVSNGKVPKSMPKKRGRWDQAGRDEGVPAKKRATSNSVSSAASSWDKENLRLCFI